MDYNNNNYGANNSGANNYGGNSYNPYGGMPGVQVAPPAAPVNDTAPMVFGIVSCATGWIYGVPGIVFGILALVFAGKARRRTGKITAAKITGGIGLGLAIFWTILYLIFFIAALASI